MNKVMNNQPIGVFDSGLGGLNVLKELRKELPHEHFIYLGGIYYEIKESWINKAGHQG